MSEDKQPEYVSDLSEQAYSEDGVDLTLIRWMLSLTPTERLQVLQQNINAIEKLKNAGISSTAT
ncbi:MAG: hypothetical protein GY749_39790 [Desulfobacteraceae bacterium]|nr:hypothetical protein [Desulfobacteraceae bacterium]